MTNKTEIAHQEVSSSLDKLKQVYLINYLAPEDPHPSKIEFAILLKSKEDNRNFAYRSIRFRTPEQLKQLIDDLTEALKYFEMRIKIEK